MSKENYVIERIEELCMTHQMSRYALSQKSGVSQAAVSALLNRKSVPTIPTIEKICDAFGITVAQFFAKDEPMPELTDDQREMVEIWIRLNERDKEIAKAYMLGLMKK